MMVSAENWSTLEQCGCCGSSIILPHLWREMMYVFFMHYPSAIVTSGYRCTLHNAAVGGSPTSSHLKGLAADISCKSPAERWRITEAFGAARIPRIVLSDSKPYVHLDGDESKSSPGVWIY